MITLIAVLSVFVVLVILIGIIFLTVPVARWYVAALMARYDFVFTNVPESYFKEVVRFGGHKKTLLSTGNCSAIALISMLHLTHGTTP